MRGRAKSGKLVQQFFFQRMIIKQFEVVSARIRKIFNQLAVHSLGLQQKIGGLKNLSRDTGPVINLSLAGGGSWRPLSEKMPCRSVLFEKKFWEGIRRLV